MLAELLHNQAQEAEVDGQDELNGLTQLLGHHLPSSASKMGAHRAWWALRGRLLFERKWLWLRLFTTTVGY